MSQPMLVSPARTSGPHSGFALTGGAFRESF